MHSIKVHVVRKNDRDKLVMRYRCPDTGKTESRSTGTPNRRQAERIAAKWEAELQEGRYQRTPRMPWWEFRRHWEAAKLGTMKPSTASGYVSTLNEFARLCKPERLGDLTTARVTAFAAELRKNRTRTRTIKKKGEKPKQIVETYRLTEASVARHLRHLKAVSRWAERNGLLPKAPSFEMPARHSGAQRMKGRPITLEEFERMLASTATIVGDDAAASWKFLLRGLWWSGLRLGEAMALRWDHQPGGASVALDGRKSVLVFDSASQKSGKTQLVPLAPEAVELLEPQQRPAGHVFTPERRDGAPMARDVQKASKILSRIGAAAGIVTDPSTRKTASAHDLRRAFGFRWSRRVMPATLRELMRHASIETTMTYYVGQNAATTAGELWDAMGSNPGSTAAAASSRDTGKATNPR